MLSYSNFATINYFTDQLPESQTHNCEITDTYTFLRQRLGNKIVTASGEKYGAYLYRNTRNNVLIASHEKPTQNKVFYSAYDIGINTDALLYYKNN